MRQVPHYLIIGNGRVASHIRHYFSQLRLSYSSWHRQQPPSQLLHELNHTTHILLLISDHAIENFCWDYLQNNPAIRIHFSGSLVTSQAYGVHPLMTFNDTLYEFQHYQSIPFILDHDAIAFEELFPGLPNQHMRLHKSLKPKYHALCVLSGNFSCLLWQKLFTTLESEFNLPPSAAYLYLSQQTQNLLTQSHTALTGPLVRNDHATIEKNITALEGDPFQLIYKSFVDCYMRIKEQA